MDILNTIKNGTTIWPRNSTPGYILGKDENFKSKRYIYRYEKMHCNIHSSIIYNGPDMEATQVSINRWIENLWDIYTMEYYLAIKINEMLPFATMSVDLKGIMLSEVSQTNTVWYHLYVESKK